jgi:arsenite-transporting ATPase
MTPMPFSVDAKLVLFGGKGGVGKTTCAAACAVDAAKRAPKKKVLVLSTDPAHSLGDAFDCELDDVPRRVPGATKNLAAREIDARRAFEAERDRYRKAVDDLFASVFTGRMDASFDRRVLEDLLDMSPPGIDELVAILSIVDAQSKWDLVIVDTAPTGHTLRLLALPSSALEWVHALMQILLKYRRVVGLGELAGDLTDLARRLRALIALLADRDRCAFVAVARPAELPRLETERLARGLEALGVPLSAVVVNAVTTGDCSRCAAAARAERPEIARLRRIAPAFLAPAVFPSPTRAADLLAWRATWAKGK